MSKRFFPLLWLLVSVVLAGVFNLYLQPSFAQNLANQLWMCF